MPDYDDDDDDDDPVDPPEPQPSRWQRLSAWWAAHRPRLPERSFAVDPRILRVGRYAAGGMAVAVLVYAGFVRVRDGEVGVQVNSLTGGMTVLEKPGFFFVPPVFTTFYVLDRRIQTLQMAQAGEGLDSGDAVAIKTADGSNVSLDIQASYRVVAARADAALSTAGAGNAAGELWIRSAVRAAVAAEFGKLTTEQVYDPTALHERSEAAVGALNVRLARWGLEVVAVAVQGFHFYKEYEEIIRQKKLADQEVEEQQAQGRLAAEQQIKLVAAARFASERDIATATGEGDRTRAAADGYDQRVRLEGETARVGLEKQADATSASGMAEATAMREAAAAMSGNGGVNLVALQYARQMKGIKFTGVPVLDAATTSRYKVESGNPAAASRGAQ